MSRGAKPVRWHVASFNSAPAEPVVVDVLQQETTGPDGLSDVRLEAAVVVVYGNCEELSSAQARALGETLQLAADLADSVNAGMSR